MKCEEALLLYSQRYASIVIHTFVEALPTREEF